MQNRGEREGDLRRLSYQEIISKPYSFNNYLSAVWPLVKEPLLYLSGFLSTLPVATYAFGFVLGINIQHLTLAFWNTLPTTTKALAIATTLVGLSVGTLMRVNHIPSFVKRLYEIVKHYMDDSPTFFKNNFVLTMAIATAIASLALGYYGYVWLGKGAAIGVGTISCLLSLGFRAESVDVLVEKARDLLREDNQFQKALLEELKYIKPEYVDLFDAYLKQEVEEGMPLNEEMVKNCLLKIMDSAYLAKQQKVMPIFNAPTLLWQIKDTFLRFVINPIFGVITGGAFFLYSTEMGNRGYLILCELVSNKCQMASWSYSSKMALSVFSGLSSGAMGFLSGIDTVSTLHDLKKYGGKSKKHAALVSLILAGSCVAALDLVGGSYMISHTPNLFNITPNSVKAYAFLSASEFMAGLYNVQALMSLLTKNEVSYRKVEQWLKTHKLSEVSVQALKQHSYFKQPRTEATPLLNNTKSNNKTKTTKTDDEIIEMDENPFLFVK